jgi:hypothetical protein
MKVPKKAGGWARAMRQTVEGKQVVANCGAEENVPLATEVDFFKEIVTAHKPRHDASATMDGVLGSNRRFDLCGEAVKLGLALLVRFSSLKHLADSPAARKAGISEQMLIRNPGLADRIREIPLGNPNSPRNIVWAALEEQVARDLANGFTLSQLLNKLGIRERADQPMYGAVYSANDLGGQGHVPTVLDAGSDSRFRPSPKGSGFGMTRPCAGVEPGYREYVHGKCIVKNPGLKVHTI